MIKEAIGMVVKGMDLESEMMEKVMDEIMSGEATDAQKAAFLTGLAMKGETIDEVTAAAKIMRAHAVTFHNDRDVLEIVGTGGDGSNTFNISTVASIVVSTAGFPVAKHGNRAASSKCGTADCLEQLGVKIDVDAKKSEQLLNEIGICFLFAQKYHTAMRFVGPVRKGIGIRTLFNILGPLANPAGATRQLLGVFSEELVEPMAHVLYNLGVKDAMVVYGTDGMDEISLSAPTKVCEVRDGKFTSYEITPEQFGLKRCKKEDLVGGNPEENAVIVRAILDGEEGARMDAVVLNAGAAMYIAAKELTLQEAIAKAREVIQSGEAKKQLERFIQKSQEA